MIVSKILVIIGLIAIALGLAFIIVPMTMEV